MEWISYFPATARTFWRQTADNMGHIEEIRLRVNRPIMLSGGGREWYLNKDGGRTEELREGTRAAYSAIQEMVDYWCRDSRYAYQRELRNGYLTLKGGHRVGLCGEAVLSDKGGLQAIKNISGLNLRIAREHKEAGEKVIPYLYRKEAFCNTLIISPPGAGKTTLLRDLVRRVSDGGNGGDGGGGRRGRKVGLVDERGELAACFQGIPQLDVGLRTDVMDSCPKEEGMLRLLRSMSPEVIAVDELGAPGEIEAIRKMRGCGCGLLATVHGESLEELQKKKSLKSLWEESPFSLFILLGREQGEFHLTLRREGEEKPCYSC